MDWLRARSSCVSRVLGCLVMAAALLGACSSEGLPTGFAVYRGEGFSIGYPSEWEGCRGAPSPGGTDAPAAEFRGPAGADEAGSPVIQVVNEGTQRPFPHALNFHRLLLQVSPGYKQLGEDDADVSGAERAVRIEFRQQNALPEQQGGPEIRGVNLLAEAPDTSVVNVRITAASTDFDQLQGTIDDVLRSVAVGDEVAAPSPSARDLPECSAEGSPSPSPTASP
jgi:hypothetical protein